MERKTTRTGKSTGVGHGVKGQSLDKTETKTTPAKRTEKQTTTKSKKTSTITKPKRTPVTSKDTVPTKPPTTTNKKSSTSTEPKPQKSKRQSVVKKVKALNQKRDTTIKEKSIPEIHEEHYLPEPVRNDPQIDSRMLTDEKNSSEESISRLALSPLGQRRNGCSQNAIYLRSAPTSPDRSPVSSPEISVKSASPSYGRRKAFFNYDVKNVKDKEKRRDALCTTTDKFAEERIAVRVLRKKF